MGALDYDVAVIGAGFGGLGAALSLAEHGAKVLLCEALNYPGGCASTFRRNGYRFESGATLFSGFAPGQLFHEWIHAHRIPVEIDFLDPLVELRAPRLNLFARADRDALESQFFDLPDAPVKRLRAFFQEQQRVADALWSIMEAPELLPPFGPMELLRHAARVPRYLPLVRAIGRPVSSILARHGLADFQPLRTYLDALCQITVQCGVAEAEAPFALATMDYYFRGTGHVRGGIGELAWGLVRAIESLGGDVRLANRVQHLHRGSDHWKVVSRKGQWRVRKVVANLLPQDVRRVVGLTEKNAFLDRLSAQVEDGWGAVMLYLVVRPPPGAGDEPRHLELVHDPSMPFIEGNHIFCSISGADESERAPAGLRTMTVSTHVPLAELRSLEPDGQAALVAEIQHRMRRTLHRMAPEWIEAVEHDMTASPRTFERFTGRHLGYVGGIPRRVGLGHYRDIIPPAALPNLHLVGDTIFPGQSTLATAIGGVKLAERLAPALGLRPSQARGRLAS
ncbi:MAG: FAD-dependent oxidoreductase [Myxococcota bacterium]